MLAVGCKKMSSYSCINPFQAQSPATGGYTVGDASLSILPPNSPGFPTGYNDCSTYKPGTSNFTARLNTSLSDDLYANNFWVSVCAANANEAKQTIQNSLDQVMSLKNSGGPIGLSRWSPDKTCGTCTYNDPNFNINDPSQSNRLSLYASFNCLNSDQPSVNGCSVHINGNQRTFSCP